MQGQPQFIQGQPQQQFVQQQPQFIQGQPQQQFVQQQPQFIQGQPQQQFVQQQQPQFIQGQPQQQFVQQQPQFIQGQPQQQFVQQQQPQFIQGQPQGQLPVPPMVSAVVMNNDAPAFTGNYIIRGDFLVFIYMFVVHGCLVYVSVSVLFFPQPHSYPLKATLL